VSAYHAHKFARTAIYTADQAEASGQSKGHPPTRSWPGDGYMALPERQDIPSDWRGAPAFPLDCRRLRAAHRRPRAVSPLRLMTSLLAANHQRTEEMDMPSQTQ